MFRSIEAIVAAILLSQPTMSKSIATSYAEVAQQEAIAHHFDPFTLVAIVHSESRWISSASNGRCMGLAGVCLSTHPACRKDATSGACRRYEQALKRGATNLRIAADLITANRRLCRAKTGRAGFRHWLASYQGTNRPKKGIWCGQRLVKGKWVDVPARPVTTRVMNRRRWLARRAK